MNIPAEIIRQMATIALDRIDHTSKDYDGYTLVEYCETGLRLVATNTLSMSILTYGSLNQDTHKSTISPYDLSLLRAMGDCDVRYNGDCIVFESDGVISYSHLSPKHYPYYKRLFVSNIQGYLTFDRDKLYKTMLKAKRSGHYYVEIGSQLFIGDTPSSMKFGQTGGVYDISLGTIELVNYLQYAPSGEVYVLLPTNDQLKQYHSVQIESNGDNGFNHVEMMTTFHT